MTNDELRIAIAELLGWTGIHADGPDGPYLGRPKWSDDPDTVLLPDYPNDLNAMHEAESALTNEQQDQYIDNLLRLVVVPFEAEYGVALNDTDTTWTVLHANAQQRARAFVATMDGAPVNGKE